MGALEDLRVAIDRGTLESVLVRLEDDRLADFPPAQLALDSGPPALPYLGEVVLELLPTPEPEGGS